MAVNWKKNDSGVEYGMLVDMNQLTFNKNLLLAFNLS